MRSSKLKQSRALTILVSWLDATKVPYRVDRQADRDLVVGELPVKIVDGPTEGTKISADGLTDPLDKALEVFWGVTEAAGFGRPKPVDRGDQRCMHCHEVTSSTGACQNLECMAAVPGRVKFQDAPELVAIRHREFRQVPNPPDEVYSDNDYKRIMEWYCHKFYRNNLRLCQQMGYDIGDLETYAMVYLTNFLGRWQKIGAKKGENGKMFCSYLQQRFYSDLLPLLRRKAPNILADEEAVDIGLNIHHVKQYGSGEDGEVSYCAVKNDPDPDIWEQIEELDHDQLVTVLRHHSVNGDDQDVLGAARKLLNKHWLECGSCNPFDFQVELQTFPKEDYQAVVAVARERVFKVALAELPETLSCSKCHQDLPKIQFGLRIMNLGEKGKPPRVRRQSWCKGCRHQKSVVPPPGNAARV